MIKATELRIGNLVLDSTGNVHKIERLDEKFDFSDRKPIPLTEEWLVSGGFTKPFINGHTWINGILIIIFWHGSIEYVGNNKTKIKYIHQLQNLYFCLIGEELVFSSTEP